MQAIIMAAGKGSRLGKITENIPKSFLEIDGRSLIDINVAMLKKYGVDDIIIVTGYRNEAFEEHFAGADGIRLVYNPFYETMNVLGSFFMGQEKLNDDFIYMHADTICSVEIFERMLSEQADIVLPVDFKDCDDEAMKVRIEKGQIVKITKDMPCEDAAGEFIGIAKIKKNVIGQLQYQSKMIMKEKLFSSYFEAAIQKIIDKNCYDIKAVSTDNDFWCEIDFKEDYNRAEKLFPLSLKNI